MNFKKIIIILFLLPTAASAQWIEEIDTESDWEYYYYNGTIDYNSYQLLREIAEGERIGDTLEFITSTLGLSPVELPDNYRVAGGYDRGVKTLPTGRKWSGRLRLGNRIRNESSESYLTVSGLSGGSNIYFKFRNDGKGNTLTESRSLAWKGENIALTIGNFTSDFGCGLGIGKFDYRPVSLESDRDKLNQFAFPGNSYYNGIKAEFSGNHAIIYSVKKYNDVYKNTLGSMLSAKLAALRLGITGLVTRLSSKSGSRTMGSGSIYVNVDDIGSKAELAYGEAGAGANIQVFRENFLARGWYYDDSYLNLQSSGFSYPDYQSYTDPHSEISFRQPQRGEAGFYIRYRMRLKTLEFRNAAEVWRNPRNGLINHLGFIQVDFPITRELSTLLGYGYSRKNGVIQDRIEPGVKFENGYEISLRMLTVVESGSVARDDSRFYVMGSLPLRKGLSLAGRVRWRYDGEFDYFIEESAYLSADLYLKATYRWSEDSGKELGSLYAYLENRF